MKDILINVAGVVVVTTLLAFITTFVSGFIIGLMFL
jgi:hypothetical protein